jgi:cysteinyl-tRNA synthetase
MEDDFNSARAIGHLFDLARDVNRALDEGAGPDGRAAARTLLRLGRVLGLFTHAPAGDRWDDEILALANERETARQRKDWGRADQLRRTLSDRGVIVEDAPGGFKLKRK